MNTGCIALKPCEVTACVRIKKIGFWRLSYVELNIIKPAENDFFQQNTGFSINLFRRL